MCGKCFARLSDAELHGPDAPQMAAEIVWSTAQAL